MSQKGELSNKNKGAAKILRCCCSEEKVEMVNVYLLYLCSGLLCPLMLGMFIYHWRAWQASNKQLDMQVWQVWFCMTQADIVLEIKKETILLGLHHEAILSYHFIKLFKRLACKQTKAREPVETERLIHAFISGVSTYRIDISWKPFLDTLLF